MTMINVLIVWQDLPETTKAYRLVVFPQTEGGAKTLQTLKWCHGEFGGTAGLAHEIEQAINTVATMLEDRKPIWAEGDTGDGIIGPYDLIIVTGWML